MSHSLQVEALSQYWTPPTAPYCCSVEMWKLDMHPIWSPSLIIIYIGLSKLISTSLSAHLQVKTMVSNSSVDSCVLPVPNFALCPPTWVILHQQKDNSTATCLTLCIGQIIPNFPMGPQNHRQHASFTHTWHLMVLIYRVLDSADIQTLVLFGSVCLVCLMDNAFTSTSSHLAY